ncbi:hypothetical protein BY996DRAFT_6417560 [Phakopsora pachyrhizi]|nr:hypothetical protein BY996DRAFT_6417560 [Phakopsora pachyrhizi]
MVKSGVGTKGQSMKVVDLGIRERFGSKPKDTVGNTRPLNKSRLARIKRPYMRTGWTGIATPLLLTNNICAIWKTGADEHALEAVAQGTSSLGTKATNLVVIAMGNRRHQSWLDETCKEAWSKGKTGADDGDESVGDNDEDDEDDEDESVVYEACSAE